MAEGVACQQVGAVHLVETGRCILTFCLTFSNSSRRRLRLLSTQFGVLETRDEPFPDCDTGPALELKEKRLAQLNGRRTSMI